MKKQVLSFLLIFAMLVGMFPSTILGNEKNPIEQTEKIQIVKEEETQLEESSGAGVSSEVEETKMSSTEIEREIKENLEAVPTEDYISNVEIQGEEILDTMSEGAEENIVTFAAYARSKYGTHSKIAPQMWNFGERQIGILDLMKEASTSKTDDSAISEAFYIGGSSYKWKVFVKDESGNLTYVDNYKTIDEMMATDGYSYVFISALLDGEDGSVFPESEKLKWPEVAGEAKDLNALQQADFDAISLESILDSQSADAVTKRIILSSRGDNDTYLQWTSSNEAVITTSGSVTRSKEGVDEKVTLTVTNSKGDSKNFEVTVLAYSEDESKVLKAEDALDWDIIRGLNEATGYKPEIVYDMAFPTTLEGASIKWVVTSTDPNFNNNLSTEGKVTRPAYGEANIQNITIKAIISSGEESKEKKIDTDYVILATTKEEKTLAEKKALIEAIKINTDLTKVERDLELVMDGTKITWISSDESVVDSNGIVYRPAVEEETKSATLTATLVYKKYPFEFTDSVTLDITVLPYTDESYPNKMAAIKELEDYIISLNIPNKITTDNSKVVTQTFKASRETIDEKYEAARDVDVKHNELVALENYGKYLQAEKTLLSLPKEITFSILNVSKDEEENIIYPEDDPATPQDERYLVEKTKILVEGDPDGETDEFLSLVLRDLEGLKLIDYSGYGSMNIKINDIWYSTGTMGWYFAINGEEIGDKPIDHLGMETGDAIVLYYITPEDKRFLQEEFTSGLGEEEPVYYNFATPALSDKEALTFDVIKGENSSTNNVISNLSLPTKGHNGSTYTWTSSNQDIITKTGEVTRPVGTSSDQKVVLTATVKKGYGGLVYTKTFDLNVPAEEISQALKTLTYAKEELTLGDTSLVIENMTLPITTFNTVAVTWTSSDESILSSAGVVTLPSEKTKVTLTATLSLNGESLTKEFDVTIGANLTDEALIAKDKEALTFDVIQGENEEATEITTRLTLPTNGENGSTITWTSTENLILSDGDVLRPYHGKDNKEVTLTATLQKGEVSDKVEFALTLMPLSRDEQKLQDVVDSIDGLTEFNDVTPANRLEVEEEIKVIDEKIEDAKSAGYTEVSIKNFAKLASIKEKLEQMPVVVTLSIVGAEVANKEMTSSKWFLKPTNYLIPKGASFSDLTKAVLEGWDEVKIGSGFGYYGSMMGLGQFDGGAGSGWVYESEGPGSSQAGAAGTSPGQSATIRWKYVGEKADDYVDDITNEERKYQPPMSDYVDMTKPADKAALVTLINEAKALNEADYRNYGQWNFVWADLQTQLQQAEVVVNTETSLNYEIEAAYQTLSYSISRLEKWTIDKTDLQEIIDEARGIDKSLYREASLNAMDNALVLAEKYNADQFATKADVSYAVNELRIALSKIMPIDEVDKTALLETISSVDSFNKASYSFQSWQEMLGILEEAKRVLANKVATEVEVAFANKNLKNTLNQMTQTEASEMSEVAYQAVEDYQGTKEAWEVFDLVKFGHSDVADISGFLKDASYIIQNPKSTITDIERTTIVLSALGYDVSKIQMPDGTEQNLIAKIMNTDFTRQTWNAAIFALLAIDSGDYVVPENQAYSRESLIEFLINGQLNNGGFALSQEGTEADIDITNMAISALAPYANTGNKAVDDCIKKAVDFVGPLQKSDTNSNQMSMYILSLVSYPQDNTSLLFSIVAGGIRDYITEDKKIGYSDDKTANKLATEQGFRAFIAYSSHKESLEQPYHIYRSGQPTKALTLEAIQLPIIETNLKNQIVNSESISFTASAKDYAENVLKTIVKVNDFVVEAKDGSYGATLKEGSNEITITATNSEGYENTQTYTIIFEKTIPSDKIEVSFILNGATQTEDESKTEYPIWIEKEKYQVKDGSSLKELTDYVLVKNGYEFEVNRGTYISSINGLSEFDFGPNSGWMYLVNGEHPQVSYSDYSLKQGDAVEWHYTEDYSEKWVSQFEKDMKKVEETEKLIQALPEIEAIEYSHVTSIQDAFASYVALGEDVQVYVAEELKTKIANAMTKVSQMMAPVESVQILIKKLENITINSGADLDAVWNAYNALPNDDARALIGTDNLIHFKAMQAKFESLMGAVHQVEEKIGIIGEVTLTSGRDAMEEARAAFDALATDSQAYVTNIDLLMDAEAKLQELINNEQTEGEKTEVPFEGNDKDNRFTLEGDFAKLDFIELNGQRLTIVQTDDSNRILLGGYTNYTNNDGIIGEAVSGSVKVNLYKDFISSLPAGTHTIKVQTATGTPEVKVSLIEFVKIEEVKAPATGYEGNSMTTIATIMGIMLLIGVGYIVYRRKIQESK